MCNNWVPYFNGFIFFYFSMVNCLVKRDLHCFDKNTQVLIQDGYKATRSKISVHQLTVGDMILSVKENYVCYDKVTKCSTKLMAANVSSTGELLVTSS